MNSAGGVKSSSQTETQREVGAGGPGQFPSEEGERKLDYLASSWCFSIS